MTGSAFSCACGRIEGQIDAMPAGGLHLACYCDSCRAGALYCGAALAPEAPVELYLTPPQHVRITKGLPLLKPFAFSPKGILRWRASCCGVQMFSSQPDPKTAFMSLRTDRLANPDAAGPLRCRSFIPGAKGMAQHEGKLALAGLILKAARARLSGNWRKTPLYDVDSGQPVAEVTLVSREDKSALLARG